MCLPDPVTVFQAGTTLLGIGAAAKSSRAAARAHESTVKATEKHAEIAGEAYSLELQAIQTELESRLAATEAQAVQLESQQRAVDYNIQVNRQNESFAMWQAADVMRRGHEAASRKYRDVRMIRGEQIAAMAANGVQVGKGTMGQILDDTARMGREDVETIILNSRKEAYEYEVKAWETRNQRRLLSWESEDLGMGAKFLRDTKYEIESVADYKRRTALLNKKTADVNAQAAKEGAYASAQAARYDGFATMAQGFGNLVSIWDNRKR